MSIEQLNTDNLSDTYKIKKKLNSLDELKYGTINIQYTNSFFSKCFCINKKPKHAVNILFSFDSDNYVIDKNNIKPNDNIIFNESLGSPCPSVIKNILLNKSYIKIASSVKKNIIIIPDKNNLSDLKIFENNPFFPDIIPSKYNCVYIAHDFNYIGHTKYILGLSCISNSKFIFTYNHKEVMKDEILFILLQIFYNNF